MTKQNWWTACETVSALSGFCYTMLQTYHAVWHVIGCTNCTSFFVIRYTSRFQFLRGTKKGIGLFFQYGSQKRRRRIVSAIHVHGCLSRQCAMHRVAFFLAHWISRLPSIKCAILVCSSHAATLCKSVEIKACDQWALLFYSPRLFFLKAAMCFVGHFSLYGSVWRWPIEASFLLGKNACGSADRKTKARCTAVLQVCRIGTSRLVKCSFWHQMQSGINWRYTKPFCATSQRMVCCPGKQASVTMYQKYVVHIFTGHFW